MVRARFQKRVLYSKRFWFARQPWFLHRFRGGDRATSRHRACLHGSTIRNSPQQRARPPMPNPCLTCGACCAAFRVSFHWVETPPALDVALVERVDRQHLCMAGTNRVSPRCVALRGEVGEPTRCAAYEARPPACRETQAGDEKCRRARARHGLVALPVALFERAPDARSV